MNLNLNDALDERLARVDPAIRELVSGCEEIVIFGSTSAGLNRPNSDLDVLCIGAKSGRAKAGGLDIVLLSCNEAFGEEWLSSELANHIAHYGRWIKGAGGWRASVSLKNGIAAKNKQTRIRAFVRALDSRWHTLSDRFRKKYELKLRREVQRLLLLQESVPIPPTAVLDNQWKDSEGLRTIVINSVRAQIGGEVSDFRRDLVRRLTVASSKLSTP